MSIARDARARAYKGLFEHSPFPSIIIEADSGAIQDANQSVELYGYSSDELIGVHVSELLDADEGWIDRAVEESSGGGAKWVARHKGGRTGDVLAIYYSVGVGSAKYIAIHLLDDEHSLDVRLIRSERVRQFQVLLHFTSRIASPTTLPDLYRAVGECTIDAFNEVGAVSLWVSDEEGEGLRSMFSKGHSHPDELSRLSGHPRFEALLRRKKIEMLSASNGGFGEPFSESPAYEAIRSMAIVPLRAGGEAIGVLVLCSRDAELKFSNVDERLLHAFAVQAGIEIQRLRLIEHLREASRMLVQAQEAERRAISQDIHDEIGGLLNSLRLMLKMTRIEVPSVEEDVSESLEIVDEIISHVRDLAFRLSPRMLVDLGLVPTISSYSKRFTVRTRIEVGFHCELESDVRYDKEVESTAFRVVQESLTNASKHAKAKTVQVHVREEDGALVVHVIDDGKGFDPANVGGTSGMGLLGLKERLELIGGNLEIVSSSGEGARISAVLPK